MQTEFVGDDVIGGPRQASKASTCDSEHTGNRIVGRGRNRRHRNIGHRNPCCGDGDIATGDDTVPIIASGEIVSGAIG
ncbi:hypothetical protein [Undibacterium danionis]|uniref:PAAR domain-containing protein n=1 Tax=Undibacterium danionis TaxID=1812100 RepID=A0ABV6IIR5_9BURK